MGQTNTGHSPRRPRVKQNVVVNLCCDVVHARQVSDNHSLFINLTDWFCCHVASVDFL